MKKIMIPLILLVIAGLVTIMLLTNAQTKPDDLDQKSSRQLLDQYAKMLEGMDVQQAGLPSAAELKSASLVNPRHVRIVPLDRLKALDSLTGSIGSIMTPGVTTFYEVRGANGTVLALMEVTEKEGKHIAVSFGHRSMAEAISAAGANNPTGELVRIQALRLDFLMGTGSDGIALYSALQNIPELGIRQGAAFTDRNLTHLVQPIARRYNGLPL